MSGSAHIHAVYTQCTRVIRIDGSLEGKEMRESRGVTVCGVAACRRVVGGPSVVSYGRVQSVLEV